MLTNQRQKSRRIICAKIIENIEKHPYHCTLNSQIVQKFLVFTNIYKKQHGLTLDSLTDILIRMVEKGDIELCILNNIERKWNIKSLESDSLPVRSRLLDSHCSIKIPAGEYFCWNFDQMGSMFNIQKYVHHVEMLNRMMVDSEELRKNDELLFSELLEDIRRLILTKDPFARKIMWTRPNFKEKIMDLF